MRTWSQYCWTYRISALSPDTSINWIHGEWGRVQPLWDEFQGYGKQENLTNRTCETRSTSYVLTAISQEADWLTYSYLWKTEESDKKQRAVKNMLHWSL